jgi:hypothetical protein
VVEPYDYMFAKKIEFKIPISELDGKQDKIDVLQFEPRNGVFIKLPSQVDYNDNNTFKFQSDVGGVYVFAEQESAVS